MSHSSNSLTMAVLRASITIIETWMHINLISVMWAVSFWLNRSQSMRHDDFFGTGA